MSPEEFERSHAEQKLRVARAVVAYNAVWSAWPGLDAHSVDACRYVAMTAAIAAADAKAAGIPVKEIRE